MYGNQHVLSTNKSNSNQSWVIDLLFMAIVLGVFYALWIGGHALFTPDEGRYSEVAREMVITHDYVTPRLNGVAFLDKPILYYWLQASAIRLFGLKEWALRFWPALMGVLGCLVTYFAGRQLFNRRTGILSAVILAASPLYYGAAHYANLDLEVAVLISITLLFAALALHSTTKTTRNSYFILAYLFCALATLTKGLIGIVFPALIIGAWILLLQRWNTLKQMRLITGLLIFGVITLPWYYLVQKANPEFLHFFFVTQQVARFLAAGDYNNQTAVWFYIPIVLIGFFPWSVFVVQALAKNIKTVLQNRQQHSVELFLLLWFILIFIFFSIPKSKTIGYIIPIFPALSLIVGRYLDGLWETKPTTGFRLGVILFSIISFLIFAVAIAAPFINSFDIKPIQIHYLTWFAVIFLVAGVFSFKLLRSDEFHKIVYSFIIVAAMSLVTLLASTNVINDKSIKPIAKQIRPELGPNDEIVAFYKYYQDLPIYLERRITIVANWNAPDIAKKDNWVRELWYGMPFQNTKEWLINENTFWQRWNSDKRLIVVMNKDKYTNFTAKAHDKVQKLGDYNDIIWVSNKKS